MIVAATGTLRNPRTVLTAVQRSRLARARKSDSTVAIRALDEVTDPASRPPSATGTHAWRFTADSVRDFAWAVVAYTKPGLGLILLRDQIVGPERFDPACLTRAKRIPIPKTPRSATGLYQSRTWHGPQRCPIIEATPYTTKAS